MKSFFPKFSLVGSFLFLLLSNAQYANGLPADDTIVKHVPTLAALVGSNWTSKQTLYVDGGLKNNDGFQGTFNLQSACPLGAVDGGFTCINDSVGNHFVRSGFDGSIQQGGVLQGSAYDCSSVTGVGHTACTRVDSVFTKLQAALVFYGKNIAYFHGMVMAFHSSAVLATNLSADCEAGDLGKHSSDGIYVDIPGTIYLDHSASLKHALRSGGWSHCNVVSDAYATAYPLITIRKQIDFWGNNGTVVANGDTAVVCDTAGCSDHDLMMIGFDTCYQNSTSGNAIGDNYQGDCNVGFAGFHNLGTRKFSNFDFYQFTTHGVNGVTDGAGGTSFNDGNSEWWTPSNIVNDGTGQCKVQVTDHSTADMHTGDIIVIANLPSRESCEGQWIVTKSGSDMILNGSSYVGPTPTGSFTSGTNTIYNISDMSNIYFGQTITGVAGITNGSVVVGIDVISNFVAIQCGDVTVSCVTGTSAAVSIPFANDTTSAFVVSTCIPTGGFTCIWLSSQSRLTAGNSAGGVQAGHIATCIMLGGSNISDKDVGINLYDPHCYSFATQLHVQNSRVTNIIGLGGDTEGKTDNFAQIGMLFDGEDDVIKVEGHFLGKLGKAVIVNTTSSNAKAIHINEFNTDASSAEMTALEFDAGSAVLSGNSAISGNILFGHRIGPIFLGTGNIYAGSDLFFENDVARSNYQGGPNTFASKYNPVANNNSAGLKVNQTASVTAGGFVLSGATLDTTKVASGMGITGPANVLKASAEVDTFTPMPCIPSCTVTMTLAAKNSSSGGSFQFRGNTPPPPQIAGAADRVIQTDNVDALFEMDSFGAARPGFVGVAYGTSLGAPTAILSGQGLNRTCGRGYDGVIKVIDDACLTESALEDFGASSHGSMLGFSVTELGTIGQHQYGRVESGGIRMGPSATNSVLAPVSAQYNSVNTTASDVASLGPTSGTLTVGNTSGFPSPTAILIDHEIMQAKVISSTQFTIIARGLFGTPVVSHTNGTSVYHAIEIFAKSSSANPQFAVWSNGSTWSAGHRISTGAVPTFSGTIGTGSTTAGNDSSGTLTVGSSPGSGTITDTFAAIWAIRPVCFFQDETTLAANPVRPTTINTTYAVLTSASGSFTAGDVISWNCNGYK